MNRLLYTLLFLITIVATGCDGKEPDTRLSKISEIIDKNPTKAIELLDSIPSNSLSEADSHYFDFLSVKARDKAYIWHTSDSLILDVRKWYASHPEYELYPEATYYTARVYSDLGDKPTALRYFQEALELLPKKGNESLRLRILSQTGRLLNSLRLYNESEKYIRKSLALAEEMNDTLLVVQELQLLGSNLLRRGDLQDAWDCFEKAIRWSDNLPDQSKAKSLMYEALIKHRTGDSKNAVALITGIAERVHTTSRNTALANAAYIFRKAEMPDSALKYALLLIHSNDRGQQQIGYDVFFSISAKNKSFPDSINNYLENYRELLEKLYDENEKQLTIAQQALYNYRRHDIERKKAEKERDRFLIWIFVTIGCLVISIGIILYIRFQKQKRIIMLQLDLANLRMLKNELYRENEQLKNAVKDKEDALKNYNKMLCNHPVNADEDSLREQLKAELMNLAENNKDKYNVPETILRSDAYRKLIERISMGKIINESDPLWKEIEKVVTESSPNFLLKLNLLTSGHLSVIDFHTALLLKCGIKPSHMAIVEGRSQGSIVSRRETLGLKALDKKTGLAVVDKVIQSL